MLHTTNNIVSKQAIRILYRADQALEQNPQRLGVVYDEVPKTGGVTLWNRIMILARNLETQHEKHKAVRVLWTEDELRTLASALAIVDWFDPSFDDSDQTSIRFLIQDHLGVKNVGA
jgi:hypothetical protein